MIPHNAQIVGQPLILECIVTTVRGITSTLDIVWSNDVVLNTEQNISINLTTSHTASYTNIYIISQLSTLDNGSVYHCEIMINTSPPVTTTSRIELDVTGNLCVQLFSS